MRTFDYLVIGGGIAGLSFALKVAQQSKRTAGKKPARVAVLFKKQRIESSTMYAQGGLAAVSSADDDFELHIQDTLRAGAGLCKEEIVRVVVEESPKRIQQLIELGAEFDRMGDGDDYHLHQEGGHSRRRIYHHADATGVEIQRVLIESALAHENIELFAWSSAIDLITTYKLGHRLNQPNKVLGAYVLGEDGNVEPFVAGQILVATGGAGKVYLYTSNPDVASGDGIAMCYRAGVAVANMEFFQFHPTCLYHPKAKSFLITEAMRGEGAKLLRMDGTPFMQKYHPEAELAPRDIVARAIDSEMKETGDEHVLLDISFRPKKFIQQHFPNIYERCREYGYDISAEPIPVVPAAHYCCGGVLSDSFGATSIRDLYVAGECAYTGLHGANRLASNSLTEGLVFASRAAEDALEKDVDLSEYPTIPPWDPGSAVDIDEQVIIAQNWDEIRRFMWNYVGIVRSDKRLRRAMARVQFMQREIHDYYWNFRVTSDLLELRNLSLVAELVVRCAMARTESRGLHFNLDHPNTSDAFKRDTVISPFC